MSDRPDPPLEDIEHTDEPLWEPEEAPPDALPSNPTLRKVTIVIYILIVICVVLGLLLSMIWSGLFVDNWSLPLPESWSI